MNPADLIPAPRVARELQSGARCPVDAETPLHAGPAPRAPRAGCAATVGAATGLPLAPDVNRILLEITPDIERSSAPRATASPSTHGVIRIDGGGPAGVFWGAQTLRQLLGPDAFRRRAGRGRDATGPCRCASIEDAPAVRAGAG